MKCLFPTEGGSETESTVDSDFGRGDLLATTSSDSFFTYKPRYRTDLTGVTFKQPVVNTVNYIQNLSGRSSGLFQLFHCCCYCYPVTSYLTLFWILYHPLNFSVCHRSASAADEESFENDLEQQLEDELKLEELMKHRQEADKTCMVRLWQSFSLD